MLEERIFSVLELPKILTHLSSFAVSEAGQVACLELRPFLTRKELEEEASCFVQAGIWLAHTGFKLRSFPKLDGIWNFLEHSSKILDMDGLWGLRIFLKQAGFLVESINQPYGVENWPLLQQNTHSFSLPANSIQVLNRCISDDALLRDEASPELKLVRMEIRRLHQQCTRKVKEFSTEYNIAHYLQDDFITLSSDRYVLPLKSNFKGRLQGIIHDYSQTGETCYFEPLFLIELNNRLQELKREEREEENKIYRYITELLRTELGSLMTMYSLMVHMDMLQAKASLGNSYDGRLISFEPGSGVNLVEARHPLLAFSIEKSVAVAGKNSAIPSDITLKPEQKALIISGGNAGGKTVCLKTLGLVALMGMCALPVPVGKGSTLPFWHVIHPFIGDEQSLEDHVSTFTAQITHLSRVLQNVYQNSIGPDNDGVLVLLDEFGAGTDPAQGAALAQAVVDELMELGAYVVAATHFPALKAYALSKPTVRAASVLFDPKTNKPLFRLAYDQVGASQALDVAREHGLPESVLKRASQYLLLDGEDTSALIARLNSLAVEREQELSALRSEQDKFKQKRDRLTERFEKEKQALFESVQEEAKIVLNDWKSGRVSHKQTLKGLSNVRRKLQEQDKNNFSDEEKVIQARENETAPVNINTLVAGQSIYYTPWARKAILVERDARRDKVRLDLSGVTIWADARDISLTASNAHKVVGNTSGKTSVSMTDTGFSGQIEINYALRLDLRGKRADLALSELASFLDSAIISGRNGVEILHGRGTGALRREVHAFLKTFPAVKSFGFAPEDQGGDGVTLAELK